jgi:hypothetical protein
MLQLGDTLNDGDGSREHQSETDCEAHGEVSERQCEVLIIARVTPSYHF